MEHRWGNRITLELPVMLITAAGQRGFGILRNFSSSGGFIETTLPVAPLTPVEVKLHAPSGNGEESPRLSGFVVRADSVGLGIEWSDAVHVPTAAIANERLPARRTA